VAAAEAAPPAPPEPEALPPVQPQQLNPSAAAFVSAFSQSVAASVRDQEPSRPLPPSPAPAGDAPAARGSSKGPLWCSQSSSPAPSGAGASAGGGAQGLPQAFFPMLAGRPRKCSSMSVRVDFAPPRSLAREFAMGVSYMRRLHHTIVKDRARLVRAQATRFGWSREMTEELRRARRQIAVHNEALANELVHTSATELPLQVGEVLGETDTLCGDAHAQHAFTLRLARDSATLQMDALRLAALKIEHLISEQTSVVSPEYERLCAQSVRVRLHYERMRRDHTARGLYFHPLEVATGQDVQLVNAGHATFRNDAAAYQDELTEYQRTDAAFDDQRF